MYNVNIFKNKKELLTYLNTSEDIAWINGLGFIKSDYVLIIGCDRRLPKHIIEHIVVFNKKICYKYYEELNINNKYCYMIYSKRRKKK